jgi:hypothetical protein
MRNAFTVLLLSAMLALGAATVSAQPPQDGVYKTQDLDFLEGRYSIAFPGANTFLDAGNLINLESWDGSALGTEWRIFCPFIASVITLYYNDLGGGTISAGYLIQYAGGDVWLDGAGPWGGGDAFYTGTITHYSENRGVIIIAGNLTGLNSDHNLDADVDNYPSDCVGFVIGNTAWLGTTTTHGPKPADFPAFLAPDCSPSGTAGHWGTATDLTLTVSGCEVGTEEATWGSVKSIYR